MNADMIVVKMGYDICDDDEGACNSCGEVTQLFIKDNVECCKDCIVGKYKEMEMHCKKCGAELELLRAGMVVVQLTREWSLFAPAEKYRGDVYGCPVCKEDAVFTDMGDKFVDDKIKPRGWIYVKGDVGFVPMEKLPHARLL